ncbi:unnamed protein product [Ectocarpus sp. 6 AP-2014]
MSVEERGWDGEARQYGLLGGGDCDEKGKDERKQGVRRTTTLPSLPGGWQEWQDGKGSTTWHDPRSAAPAPATTRPERPEEGLESCRRILQTSLSSLVPSIGSSTSFHEFYERCDSDPSCGSETERMFKSVMDEALGAQTSQALPQPAVHDALERATELSQSVRELFSWEEARTERDERPGEGLENYRRILQTSLLSLVSSISSRTSFHEFYERCGSDSSFGQESERLLKSAVHEALELHTSQSPPKTTMHEALESTRNFTPSCREFISVVNKEMEEAKRDRDAKVAHQIQGGRTAKETELLRPHVQLDTATAVRQILSTEGYPSVHVPNLVQLVQHEDNPALQFESVKVLATISRSQPNVVVNNGAIPVFLRLFANANDNIREEAASVRALGYIAEDSPRSRDLVLHQGSLDPLLQLLMDRPKLTILRNATWMLSNLCRGKPPPRFEQVRPALPALARLLHSVDEEVLRNTCTALRRVCISRWNKNSTQPSKHLRVQAVIEAGVCQRLVRLIRHDSPTTVKIKSLRAISTIASSSDRHKQELVNSNVLPRLRDLLSSSHQTLREKTCQVICRITTGSKEQTQAVIEAGIILAVIHILPSTRNLLVGSHIQTMFSRAIVVGRPEEMMEWIPPLLDLLGIGNFQNIPLALWVFKQIAKVVPDSHGWQRLQHLLSSSDTEVCEKACRVIHRITSGNKEQARAAIEAGIIPVLIQLLPNANPYIRWDAASAISNITELGEPEEVRRWIPLLLGLLEDCNIQSVVGVSKILGHILQVDPNSDAWRRLLDLLSSSDAEVREKTCRVIHKITEGNKEQTRAIINAGIVPVLIQLLPNVKYYIRWERDLLPLVVDPPQDAASVILSATEEGKPEEVRGWIPPLVSLLENDNMTVILNVLEILEKVLERGDTEAKAQGQETNQTATCVMECGGWERVAECLHLNSNLFGDHARGEVRAKARELLERFHHLEDESAQERAAEISPVESGKGEVS